MIGAFLRRYFSRRAAIAALVYVILRTVSLPSAYLFHVSISPNQNDLKLLGGPYSFCASMIIKIESSVLAFVTGAPTISRNEMAGG